MVKLKILIVEDDKLTQTLMARHLSGHELDFAGNRTEAASKLEKNSYDLCFIDLSLGPKDDYSGLTLIPLAAGKGIYSVVMSAHDSPDIISRAYEAGCSDFYAKGNEEINISAVMRKYHAGRAGDKDDAVFKSAFITEDPQTRHSIKEALGYAPSGIPVLILGPSGSGKTSLARIIHERSGRKGEFVAINCAAYTEDLLEAELFGYRKGAFTGADNTRKGRLLKAAGGTLFLDEIGAMSHNMQTKLLKAVEEKAFYPVGSDKPERSDFRIISATLEDLRKLLDSGKMRFDFFQRVHGFTITLKPLTGRKCDILPLIEHFTSSERRLAFSKEAKEFLLAHNWPGNTRELKRFVELVSGSKGIITLETAQKHLTQSVHADAGAGFFTEALYEYALKNGLNKALERSAYEIIRRNLNETGGKKVKTRGNLKISTRMLYTLLKKFDGAEKPED